MRTTIELDPDTAKPSRVFAAMVASFLSGVAGGSADKSRRRRDRRVAAGRTNPEIATDLHVGLSTIKTHLGSISTKLSACNRVEIAIWAYQNGKIDSEDHQ